MFRTSAMRQVRLQFSRQSETKDLRPCSLADRIWQTVGNKGLTALQFGRLYLADCSIWQTVAPVKGEVSDVRTFRSFPVNVSTQYSVLGTQRGFPETSGPKELIRAKGAGTRKKIFFGQHDFLGQDDDSTAVRS